MENENLDLAQLQAAIQQAGASWVAGQTSLTELALSEKQLRLGAVPPPGEATLDEREQVAHQKFQAEGVTTAIGAPASFDLRNINGKNFITPIKNQRNCGSCVAFGSIATVEGTLRLKRDDPNLAVDLSEAHLFYCHAAAQGRNCDNGWWVDPALEAFKTVGVADEPCFPYTPGDQACKPCTDWQNRVTKISAWRKLTTIADMKSWISINGPVAACFKVYDDFYSYHSGVYHHVTGELLGGHCICVIGYNDAEGCWLCKNSWGTNWGEEGFFKIAYGECGIDYTMWAVEVAVTPGGLLEKKLITGLWCFNEERKAEAFIDGVGWRKVSAKSDSIFLGMLTLLSSAKTSKSPVTLRIENEVITEVYVF